MMQKKNLSSRKPTKMTKTVKKPLKNDKTRFLSMMKGLHRNWDHLLLNPKIFAMFLKKKIFFRSGKVDFLAFQNFDIVEKQIFTKINMISFNIQGFGESEPFLTFVNLLHTVACINRALNKRTHF